MKTNSSSRRAVTYLIEKRVNIVSLDERFARMLQLECERMDVVCTVSDTLLEGFAIYTIDYDHISPNMGDPSGSFILISETPSNLPISLSKHAHTILERPFLMSDFRARLSDIFVSLETKQEKMPFRKSEKLWLDHKKQLACIGSKHTILLTPAEYILLCELYKRNGKALSKADAISLLGGKKSSNLYEVHICSLRKKLAAVTNRKYIYTLRGKGYYLKEV